MPIPQQSQTFEEHPVVTRTNTKAKTNVYTGKRGEIIWDRDRKTLIELDGSVKGGRPIKFFQQTTVTTTPYTVLDSDTFIAVNVNAATVINLPPGEKGRHLVVKDISGAANTNNITVTPSSGENIDGSATYVINTAYGAVEIGWVPS